MNREIYMDHPEHGAHAVFSETSAQEMEKKGWLRRPSKYTTDKMLAIMGLKRDGDKFVPIEDKKKRVKAD